MYLDLIGTPESKSRPQPFQKDAQHIPCWQMLLLSWRNSPSKPLTFKAKWPCSVQTTPLWQPTMLCWLPKSMPCNGNLLMFRWRAALETASCLQLLSSLQQHLLWVGKKTPSITQPNLELWFNKKAAMHLPLLLRWGKTALSSTSLNFKPNVRRWVGALDLGKSSVL